MSKQRPDADQSIADPLRNAAKNSVGHLLICVAYLNDFNGNLY